MVQTRHHQHAFLREYAWLGPVRQQRAPAFEPGSDAAAVHYRRAFGRVADRHGEAVGQLGLVQAHGHGHAQQGDGVYLPVMFLHQAAGSPQVPVAAQATQVQGTAEKLHMILALLASAVLLAALYVGALMLGERLASWMGWRELPRALLMLIGLVMILLPETLGDLLGPVGRWIDPSLDVLSGLLTFLALSAGLGALILARLPALQPDVPLVPGETPASEALVPG